jgi:hypothetical protein
VDCAIARTNEHWVSPWIEEIGAFDPRPLAPARGMRVVKVGMRTQRTTGIIESTTHRAEVDYTFPTTQTAYFEPLIKILPDPVYPAFSAQGDSGALVLESTTLRPVGMIISGDSGSDATYQSWY